MENPSSMGEAATGILQSEYTLGFGWHFQTFKGHSNFQLLQSKFPPTSHPYAPHLYASSVPNICAPIHNLSNQGILPETMCSLSVCFTKKFESFCV